MSNPSFHRQTGPATVVLLGVIFATAASGLLFGWRSAVFILVLGSVISAYTYAGWERAWFVGLLSALFSAFFAGTFVPLPDGSLLAFLISGLWSFVPALLAAVMMFVGASEVLVIWRFGDRRRAWQVMAGLLSMTLGRARTLIPGFNPASFSVQVVSKGQIAFSSPPIQSRPILGPGILVVESGNALLLEKNGKFTRIVGPGLTITDPYEAISAVLDLRLQTAQFASQMQVLTKDGIPLELSCTVQYRIHCDEQVLIDEARYKLDERIIRRAVLNATDWKADTELVARTALRAVIAEHYLDQILYSPRTIDTNQTHENARPSGVSANGNQEPNRLYLSRRVQRELADQTKTWGVEITKVTLDEIIIPAEVKNRIFEHWNVEWIYDVDIARAKAELRLALQQREVAKARAEGETDTLVIKAKGKKTVAEIDAEAEVEKARAQAEATAIKGRAQAEARAELFRRMLLLEPAMDRNTLWAILRRLRSDEELQFMGRLYASANERRYPDNLLRANPEGGDEEDRPGDQPSAGAN